MMSQKRVWVVPVLLALVMMALVGAVQTAKTNEEGGWEFAIVPQM